MTRMERRERHRLIIEAIEAGVIHSQRDVVRILAKHKIVVTQATASRDLDEIGAVRGKDVSGNSRYLMPDSSRSLIDDLTLGIEESSRTLVLKTPPGAAQLIAGRIDRAGVAGVIGTIAGDDTVFVACDKSTSAKSIRAALLVIASSGEGARKHQSTKMSKKSLTKR